MATNITSWYPEINPDIPNAPAPALIQAVRKAAIAFCEKTHLWEYTLTAISIVADTQDYTLTLPSNSALIRVESAKYKANGADNDQYTTLTPVSEILKDIEESGSWNFVTGPSPTEYYVDNVNNTLSLLPIPDTASTSGLLVKVILKPDRTCTTLEDFLYDDHVETIGYGAKAELFGRKGMPWYDPSEQSKNAQEFMRLCNNLKTQRITGATSKRLRVRMRPFA